MKAHKFKLAPNKGRELKAPTEYPESETDQKATMSIAEMFQRYNQEPEAMDKNYFDASQSEYLRKFLRPNLDLTDLDELNQFNQNLTKNLNEAIKKQKADKTAEDHEQPSPGKQLDVEEEAKKAELEKQSKTNKDVEDK